MSMSFSDDSSIVPSTVRGRDWPCLRQFAVVLENRVGSLHELLRHLEGHDLRVMALSIADSIDCAIIRIVVDNYERGKELFDLSPFTVFENDIIGVELPDDPQPYVSICLALLQAELNIQYTYPLLFRRRGHAAIALRVENVDQALVILKEKGLRTITETDLLNDDDEFF